MTEPATLVAAIADAEVVAVERTEICGTRHAVAVRALRRIPEAAVPEAVSLLRRAGARPVGPPVAIFRQRTAAEFQVTVGCPVRTPVSAQAGIVADELPGGHAVQAIHLGPYETLPSTYDRLAEWLTGHRFPPPSLMWEEYVVGPDDAEDPGQWRTRIVLPLPASFRPEPECRPHGVRSHA
ncbi:GyrI-like domain-containing protein [Actinoplanes sp. NPDC049316]|uniref:GyrI-like domain-containing protein n=1 Tax=Actinoplanes sp. NPDC049316 TaxID=3154727 RepID=UPI003425C6E1